MNTGNASSLARMPGRELASVAPISTKFPVTCAVNSPNSATKPQVSTKPAMKAISVLTERSLEEIDLSGTAAALAFMEFSSRLPAPTHFGTEVGGVVPASVADDRRHV